MNDQTTAPPDPNVPLRFRTSEGNIGWYNAKTDQRQFFGSNPKFGKPANVTWLDVQASEEVSVIESLALASELTHTQVLRQALRTYQLIATGHSKLVELNPLPKMSPIATPAPTPSPAEIELPMADILQQIRKRYEHLWPQETMADRDMLDELIDIFGDLLTVIEMGVGPGAGRGDTVEPSRNYRLAVLGSRPKWKWFDLGEPAGGQAEVAEFHTEDPAMQWGISYSDGRAIVRHTDGNFYLPGDESATPIPTTPPKEPIPSGVYYNIAADNFYDAGECSGMGAVFYRRWQDRWKEFPAGEGPAIPTVPNTAIESVKSWQIGGKIPWDFCCEWYGVDEIYESLNRKNPFPQPVLVPGDVHSREFASWLAHQYRLAMHKGMELARRNSATNSPPAAETAGEGPKGEKHHWEEGIGFVGDSPVPTSERVDLERVEFALDNDPSLFGPETVRMMITELRRNRSTEGLLERVRPFIADLADACDGGAKRLLAEIDAHLEATGDGNCENGHNERR